LNQFLTNRTNYLVLVPSYQIVSFDGLPMMDDASIDIASLAVPLTIIAIDAVAELRRLHQPPMPVGRVVRYSLSWSTGNN
jgi:hypothetical protein